MTNVPVQWEDIARIVRGELPKIDQALSKANVPLRSRVHMAFGMFRDVMMEVADEMEFLQSTAHGRFLVIIDDWYRNRYGDTVREDEKGVFVAAVFLHGTPFLMRIPRVLKTPADEPDMIWIHYPGSVLNEEDPLNWIASRGVVDGLSDNEIDNHRVLALETANLARSINIDLWMLENEEDLSIAELAGSIRADIQSSARNLCERNESNLRSSGWDASQATEKALKLLLRANGVNPPRTHDLPRLAQEIVGMGGARIDQAMLDRIPSDRNATDLRYGGEKSLSEAADAYRAALAIIKEVVVRANINGKINLKHTRIKLKRPPWFDFDTKAFSEQTRRIEAS